MTSSSVNPCLTDQLKKKKSKLTLVRNQASRLLMTLNASSSNLLYHVTINGHVHLTDGRFLLKALKFHH